MTQSQSPRQVSPLKSPVQKSYAKLPPYLHKRGSHYYFKRKVPADAAVAFPGCGEQIWKALGTPLLEKARMMLAVEVAEFEFTLARFRRERAVTVAGVGSKLAPGQTLLAQATFAATPRARATGAFPRTRVSAGVLASLDSASDQPTTDFENRFVHVNSGDKGQEAGGRHPHQSRAKSKVKSKNPADDDAFARGLEAQTNPSQDGQRCHCSCERLSRTSWPHPGSRHHASACTRLP